MKIHSAQNSEKAVISSVGQARVPLLPPGIVAGEEIFGCPLAPRYSLQFLARFQFEAFQSYVLGAPNRDHLLSLSRLNVHRAIIDNILAIGMTPAWMKSDDSVSIFNLGPPEVPFDHVPPSLRPSSVQLRVSHHPWLDFFPFPGMRDRLILAGELLDDDDLCHDLMAFWDTRNTGATLLVWGHAWEPQNWEVTESFVRKWKWLLFDSPELLASTNRWRAYRREPLLNWNEIFLSSP